MQVLLLQCISNFLGHISNCGREDTQPACTSSLPSRCALLLGQPAALLFSLASNCRLLLWVIFEKWTSSCHQHKLGVTWASSVSLAVNKLHPCLKDPVCLPAPFLFPSQKWRRLKGLFFSLLRTCPVSCIIATLGIYTTPIVFKAWYKVFSSLALGTHRKGVIIEMKKLSQRSNWARCCWGCDYNLIVWGPKSPLFTQCQVME